MKNTSTLMIALFLVLLSTITQASVVYMKMNLTADQSNTWKWFQWGPDSDGYGLWVNPAAALRIETYKDGVIGYDEGGKIFLSAVPYDTLIGPLSNWQVPQTASYINDATHTGLNGTKIYAGFKLRSASEQIFYGWMHLDVSPDGLSVTLIDMAYEDQADTPINAGVVQQQVIYESGIFRENLLSNDGHIANNINIQLLGVKFKVTSGAMTENTHFEVGNVPAGLKVEISATDSVHAIVSLTGKALAHQVSDTVNDLIISFLDAAFDGISAAAISNADKTDLFIKYFGDSEVVYEDLTDPVCGVGDWVPFQSFYFENYFGIWNDGTDMRLETYDKDVVGHVVTGRSYVTPLALNTPISQGSAWVASAQWPNESYLTSAAQTTWYGQEKYAGIKLILDDAVMYGWIHLGVSADGKEITVFDWAFNTKPGDPINAGQIHYLKSNFPKENHIEVYPNPCRNSLYVSNDGLTGNTRLRVLDLYGKVLIEQNLGVNSAKKTSVSLADLSAGIYILQLTNGQHVFTQKVIKD